MPVKKSPFIDLRMGVLRQRLCIMVRRKTFKKVDKPNQWILQYFVGFPNTYLLDSDLSRR